MGHTFQHLPYHCKFELLTDRQTRPLQLQYLARCEPDTGTVPTKVVCSLKGQRANAKFSYRNMKHRKPVFRIRIRVKGRIRIRMK
jgi:hypothetical protein